MKCQLDYSGWCHPPEAPLVVVLTPSVCRGFVWAKVVKILGPLVQTPLVQLVWQVVKFPAKGIVWGPTIRGCLLGALKQSGQLRKIIHA